MRAFDCDVRRQFAEVLILSLLDQRPRHGYELSRMIRASSGGQLTLHVDLLYPLLYRLEERGWVHGMWVEKADQQRRRFYQISPAGRRVFARHQSTPHPRCQATLVPISPKRYIATRLLTVLGVIPLAANCAASINDHPVPARDPALEFFLTHIRSDLSRDIAALRPPPLSPVAVRHVLSTLPLHGALQPIGDETRRLAALKPILQFHQRDDGLVIKVIDVPQAVVGLHARAVLLISRAALRALTTAELQAVVAHELGHEFFWDEYVRLRERPVRVLRQQLELRCDGIAVVTLVSLGLDPARLPSALGKLTRFNEALSAMANTDQYPSLTERARFIRVLTQHVTSMSSTRRARAR